MTIDPFARTEDVPMPFMPPPERFIPSTPLIRQATIDWRLLSDAEQRAVRAWETGDLPLAAVPERGRVFIGRHRRIES